MPPLKSKQDMPGARADGALVGGVAPPRGGERGAPGGHARRRWSTCIRRQSLRKESSHSADDRDHDVVGDLGVRLERDPHAES